METERNANGTFSVVQAAPSKLTRKGEGAAAKARRKVLTAAQAHKVIAEMVAISSGESMNFHTVRSWLNDWLTNKTGAVSERTLFRYQQVVRDFLAHMGSRAEASIASASPPEIVAFRNKLREEGQDDAQAQKIPRAS